MRARLALAVLLTLEAAAVGLVATRVPAVTVDLRDPVGWLRRTDPETATLALGRWLVLLVAAWLLLTTLLALTARLLAPGPRPPRRLRRLVDGAGRCAPGAVRHLVEAAITVGVVAAAVAPAAASTGSRRSPRAAVPAASRSLVAPLGPVRSGRAAPLPDARPLPAPAPAPSASSSTPATPAAWGRHRVAEGEHLWGIAETVVQARGGGDDPAAVDRYWRALCDANRDRLASGDPNVVTPGEDLDLPPVA